MNTKWILGLVALLLAARALSQEYSSEELQRLVISNLRHLCEWSKTHAPEGNPVVISACQPDGDATVLTADKDTNAWWAYWRDNDEATFDRLSKEWDAELARTNALYVAQKKTEAQRQAKAAHLKLIASLPSKSVPELCSVIRRGKTPEALEELVKRKAFPADETALIAGRRVNLGMSEGAMLCALGDPERAHRSVGSWGVHIQYVFTGVIVYVENGKVTSWQD